MKRIVFLLALIIVPSLIFGQEIEFGEVTKEELLEKSYPQDSSANAAILYKKQDTYFNANLSSVELVTEIHERIKIYSKDGFDHATVVVDLFNGRSDEESIGKIKAYTYNLEGDKIVKTELDKDQIFENELSYNYNQVKFTMPNIKEGSVLEYKYVIRSPFFTNIDEFTFQYDIPVKKVEAEIRTPKGFRFNQTSKGFIGFYPKRSSKQDARLGMSVDILNYTLNNVPALKEENFVDNIDNYRAGVMFELVSIEFPGSAVRSYARSWSDVAKTIGNSDDYKNQLDKTRSFDDLLDQLIEGKNDKMEKMGTIFKYVKDNIKWNGYDGKYFYNGLKKTLNEKKGNSADINLMLVAMLRYAGLDANPVIISTKDNMIPLFPTVDRLNYVIAYVRMNGKEYFLDATEEFSDINILPLKDYNWQGILIDNENMVWNLINIGYPEQTINQYAINATLNDEGELNGKLKSRYSNHGAYLFRNKVKDKDLEVHITNRESELDHVEISNYEMENANQYEGNVSESFDFYYENASEVINDKIYLKPLSFLSMETNPFIEETRDYPIDFGYAFKEMYNVNIAIPEGYSVETLPQSAIMKLPDDLGSFRYITQTSGSFIQLLVNFEISRALIGPDKYSFLKEYFSAIINKEAEQIVLAKL